MHENQLFEYAVIRVVPCVEREEFINVGVIMFCSTENFLQSKFYINEDKLNLFHLEFSINDIRQRLNAFQKICAGGKTGGNIGKMPLASRFRWLTSTRSTVVQISKVHPGLCTSAESTFEKLFNQLVL